MGNVEYDIIKLKQLGDIDARRAIKHFDSYEEYFMELYKFAKESNYFLRTYAVDMVVKNENERREFRAEIKKIRNSLVSLGISYPIPTLSEVDYEAQHGNVEALAGWINKFHIEIGKISAVIAEAQTASETAPTKEVRTFGMEKPLILAADDKPELLAAVVNMLGERFKVMAVTNGKDTLKLIEKHPPKLFLLDIEMPQMNGYELAEMIRKQEPYKQTPIIFLTSKNTREDVMAAVKRGGSDYLVKPVTKDLLLNKVLKHLGMA